MSSWILIIPLVTSICEFNPDVFLHEPDPKQVEHLSSIGVADLATARAFYGRNHVRHSGMSEFLRGALESACGEASKPSSSLRQAMGGGKTHNMNRLGPSGPVSRSSGIETCPRQSLPAW